MLANIIEVFGRHDQCCGLICFVVFDLSFAKQFGIHFARRFGVDIEGPTGSRRRALCCVEVTPLWGFSLVRVHQAHFLDETGLI